MIKIKSLFTKKYRLYHIIAVIILVALFYVFFIKKAVVPETITIQHGDFLQQVSVSGKVVATENLELSFEQAGIIKSVLVKVGDVVTAGKLLVSQDTAQLYTQLSEMQAGIDLQKAKLNQLLAGSSDEEIKIAEDGLALAKQDLRDAYDNALTDINSAHNHIYNALTTVTNIRKTYFYDADIEGIKVQTLEANIIKSEADAKKYLDVTSDADISAGILALIIDLNDTYKNLSGIRDQCDLGVYYSRVPAASKTSLDTQKTNINTALTTIKTAQQSISSNLIALKQAENELNSVKAPSRLSDIAVFEAQIKQAEASAQNVLTQIRKRQIFAPIDGIITHVDAKIGSILSSGQNATSLISTGKFQIESYVPEIYIPLIKIGDTADVTLDSYGPDKIFMAKVISIDPSETVKDGVSTYKIKLELQDENDGVRDGMTANVIITTKKKSNVISILQGIVITKNGKKFVKVLQGKDIVEREVILGDYSSSGDVEIISGLQEGDVVIVK